MDTRYLNSYGDNNQYVDHKTVEQMSREASKIITEQIRQSSNIQAKAQEPKK